MNIVNYALKALTLKAKAFEKSAQNPLKAQKKILFEYLARNKNTEYGLKYGFSKVKSIEQYQTRVPLSEYEDFRSFMDKMAAGKPNILTADKPVFFSVTSGTSGKPKFIPVTKYSRSKKARTMSLMVYYIFSSYPDIASGKMLVIVSPEIEGKTASGVPYGAETGHGYKNLPRMIKRVCALPYEVFEIKNYEAKYYCILRLSLEQNITAIATMNPSTIILLCEKALEWKEKIIEDIEKGTLDKNLDISCRIRKTLEKNIKPNPGKAQNLKEIFNKKGEFLPKYFWPNMKLIICWKAGTLGLYLKEFPNYFGNVPVRDFGYLSSETRGSISIDNENAGGVLAINTNFYEFIPREDIGKKEKNIFLCDGLEKGKEYFIIMTTPCGLYRYNIGDIVRVTGFFNKTPIIEFVQRGLNVTSVTGEKLYESHITEAVNKAIDENKVSVKFFTAFAQWGKPPRYTFLTEFSETPTLGKKRSFLKSIEKGLSQVNREYKEKRSSQRLGSPVLKVVKRGGFEKYKAKKIEEGAYDSQFKMPELTKDLNFAKNFDIEEDISLCYHEGC